MPDGVGTWLAVGFVLLVVDILVIFFGGYIYQYFKKKPHGRHWLTPD